MEMLVASWNKKIANANAAKVTVYRCVTDIPRILLVRFLFGYIIHRRKPSSRKPERNGQSYSTEYTAGAFCPLRILENIKSILSSFKIKYYRYMQLDICRILGIFSQHIADKMKAQKGEHPPLTSITNLRIKTTSHNWTICAIHQTGSLFTINDVGCIIGRMSSSMKFKG